MTERERGGGGRERGKEKLLVFLALGETREG